MCLGLNLMRAMRRKTGVGFLSLLGCMGFVNFACSTTISWPLISEEEILGSSEDVVVADVVAVDRSRWDAILYPLYHSVYAVGNVFGVDASGFIKEPCFGEIYSLRVTKSYKSKFKVGSLVYLGSFRRFPDIKVSDVLLATVRRPVSDLTSTCTMATFARDFPIGEIREYHGRAPGVFRVERDSGGKVFYKVRDCSLFEPEYVFFMQDFVHAGVPYGFIEDNERSCLVMDIPEQIFSEVFLTKLNKPDPGAGKNAHVD